MGLSCQKRNVTPRTCTINEKLSMPQRTPKACRVRGCRNTTTDQSGYCEQHKSEGWKQNRISLLSLAVNCPDGQGITPRRQPPEPVLRVRSLCAAYQPVTVVFRRHVQAQRKRNALNDPRCVPARQYLILSLLRQNFRGQMLYRRGNGAVNRSVLRVERCPVKEIFVYWDLYVLPEGGLCESSLWR